MPCVIAGCDQIIKVPLREFYESYEFFCENADIRHEISTFLAKLKSRETFYDIGGFRGAFSAAAKIKLGGNISIHIFEPLAKNVEAIHRVCKLNGFDDIKVNPVAVSDGNSMRAGVNDDMVRLGDVNSTAAAEFPSVSLDEYVAAGNPPPSIMKIDVEGFELQVLNGGRQCLARHRPRLWLEVHPRFLAAQNKSQDQVLNLLKEHGYAISFFDDYSAKSDSPYHVWCE
ncbi:MAG TPA: FkbM family methyltransferase [Verrucomicrobiae bacterium]